MDENTRIEDHEQRIRTLEEDNFRRDEREKNIFTELGEIKAQLVQLLCKPAQRWDALIAAIIAATIGGVVGHFLK